ncbi:superoxide dismutase family protein [Paenibacillus chartarius]|uniref:Superoxide dismutase [Cu-Zn] n=1 Tax=Paenibacillus chartarius TaxID=747481 RepID=A0ABV6DS31_9BACL
MKHTALLSLLGAAMMTSGCALFQAPEAKETNAAAAPAPAEVTVGLIDNQGRPVGQAQLKQLQHGVLIDVKATGLTPGLHGFHIHETGKCVLPDFKSAGAHFNPGAKKHGHDNPAGPHAGDIPNLVAEADGSAQAQFIVTTVTLKKNAPNSLLKAGGTALVIHAGVDDLATDPAGNAGDRIVCGVIQ